MSLGRNVFIGHCLYSKSCWKIAIVIIKDKSWTIFFCNSKQQFSATKKNYGEILFICSYLGIMKMNLLNLTNINYATSRNMKYLKIWLSNFKFADQSPRKFKFVAMYLYEALWFFFLLKIDILINIFMPFNMKTNLSCFANTFRIFLATLQLCVPHLHYSKRTPTKQRKLHN